MAKSKDGRMFSSRQAAMAHDRKAAPAPEPEEEMDGGMDGGEESPESVAQMHGPAHEVHVTHDHEGGMHHVHSVHADGYEHHSDHASAGEAHDHAKGLSEAQEESDEEEIHPGIHHEVMEKEMGDCR